MTAGGPKPNRDVIAIANTGGDHRTYQAHFSPSREEVTTEYVPTKEEIYKMAGSGRLLNLRDRAIILCFYTSGLRSATPAGAAL